MQPEDNSLDGSNQSSAYSSSLETTAPVVTSVPIRRRPSLFKFNRMAFTVTGATLAAIVLIAGAAFLINNIQNTKADSIASKQGSYDVGTLPVNGVKQTDQLSVGTADRLAVNGQLNVSNTVVLTPTSVPAAPEAGQIYYDKTVNSLFYYNGSVFVPVANQNTIVSSLGGMTGAVNAGAGLSAVGGSLQNTGVLSIQGQTGNVTFTAGGGVDISGTTVSLTALPAGQLVLGTGASGFTTVAQAAPGQCLISTAGAPVFGSCTGSTQVTSLNGLVNAVTLAAGAGVTITPSGNTLTIAAPASAAITAINGQTGPTLTVANATASSNTITINNALADGSTEGIAAFNATNFTATGGATNVIDTIQGISTGASPTFANLTSSGYLKGTELRNGTNVVFTLPVSGSGSSRTLCYVDNSNASNCPTGGNVSFGTTHTTNKIAALDGSGNLVDSQLSTLAGGLQFAGSSYLLDLVNGSDSTLTVDNSGAGVANLTVTGKITASQGLLQGTDTYILPSNGGNGGTLCYVYSGTSNCPTGGNVSYDGTHAVGKFALYTSLGITDSVLSQSGGNLTAVGNVKVSNTNTTALQIQDASSNDVLVVNTTNGLVGIGAAPDTSFAYTPLQINGALRVAPQNTPNVPTANASNNGTIYYSNTDDSFYIIEEGLKKKLCNTTDQGCGAGANQITLQGAYDNGDGTISTDSTTLKDIVFILDATQNSNFLTNILGSGRFAVQDNGIDSFVVDNTGITANLGVTVSSASGLTLGAAGPGGATGKIVLQNSTNSNTVSIQSGTTGTSYALTLPVTVASNNDDCLKSTTGGVLSWGTCLSGGGSGGGVTALNSLSGSVDITSLDSSVTIDDTTTPGKIDLSVSGSVVAGFASTSLNNLVATSINQSLTPGSSGKDLGSSSQAWQYLYLGSGANSIKFDGSAATAARTITLDNLSGHAVVAQAGTPTAQTGGINVSGTIVNGGKAGFGQAINGSGAQVQVAGGIQSAGSIAGNNANLEGTIVYDTTTDKFYIYEGATGAIKEVCNKVDNACGASPTTTLQGAYTNYGSSAAVINLSNSGSRNGVVIQDAASTLGDLFTVSNNGGGTKYLNVTNAGVAVTGLTVSSTSNFTGLATFTGGITDTGSFSQTGTGTFGTGTGNVSLNGNTAITGAGTLTVASFGAGAVQSNGSGLLSSGTLTVANGGTGATTLTLNGILFGNGTSAVQATSAAANSILATNGSSVPGLTQTLPNAVQDNITRTGAIATGSIASGFGTISTGSNITTSATLQGATGIITGGLTVQGSGGVTIGTTTQVGNLVMHDGNGQTTTLQAGDTAGNLTFVLPTLTGNANQCIKKQSGNQLFFDDCLGGSGGSGGVSILGAIDGGGTSLTNGGIISGATLYLQHATASLPGLVSVSSQTFAGAKTFNALGTFSAGLNATGAASSINASSNFDTNINTGTSTGAAVNIGNNTGSIALTLNSGTGTIAIGTGGQARTVNIATGAAAQAVTLGSTNTTSALTLQSGTGGIQGSATTVSGTAFGHTADSITTGTGLNLTTNALTTGNSINISTTSAALTSGNLANINQTSAYTSETAVSGSLINTSRVLTMTNAGSPSVAFDAAYPASNGTSYPGAFVTTTSWNHTVGTHSNRALVVTAVARSGTSTGCTATYGTQSMGAPVAYGVGAQPTSYVFVLKNPDVGTKLITLTCAGSDGTTTAGSSSSWYNVDQTTPYVALTSDVGASVSSATVSGTTVVGDAVVGALAANTASAPTGTALSSCAALGYFDYCSSYKLATTTTTSLSYSISNFYPHAMSGVILKKASGYGLNVDGAVANFSSSCTATGPAICVDYSNILKLTQNNTTATGAVLNIQNAGTGLDIQLARGTIQTAAGATSNGVAIQSGAASGGNSGSITIDSGTATGTAGSVNIGTANAPTINIGNNNLAHTINIGSGGSSTSQTINIGSNQGAGAVTLTSGTSGVAISTAATTTTGVGITSNSNTTGNAVAITANGLTSGAGFAVSTANSNYTGNLLNINQSTSYTLPINYSNNSLSITKTNTVNATGSVTLDAMYPASNGASYSGFTVMTTSWNHTVGNYTNRALVVTAITRSGNSTGCSATYGTQPMGNPVVYATGFQPTSYVFVLKNPDVGTNLITLVCTGDGTTAVGSSASFYNVDQTTPYTALTSDAGSGTSTATVSGTTVVGDAVVGSLAASSASGPTGTPMAACATYTYFDFCSSYKYATTTTTSLTYNISQFSPHAMSGVILKKASNALISVSGSVASFSSSCTSTAGICADSSNILNLNQQYASATGAVANIQNAGTGASLQTANINDTGLGLNVLNMNGSTVLSTSSANLMLNASIETDANAATPTNWSVTGAGNTIVQSNVRAKYGTSSGLVTSTGTAGVLTANTSALIANATYTVSFWIYNGSAAAPVEQVALGGTNCASTTTFAISTTWTQYSCTITTAASANTLTITMPATVTNWNIDGVRVNIGSSISSGGIQLNGAVDSVVVFRNNTNSTTAFQIQNSAGTTLFAADTTNMRINVGTQGAATGQLFVAGNMPAANLNYAGTASSVSGVAVQGRYAYVSTGTNTSGFQVFDVSNPASPLQIGSANQASAATKKKVKVQGKYAYVSSNGTSTTGTFEVFDISNPKLPVSVGSQTYTTTGNTNLPALYVQGKYAYVGDGSSRTLWIFDVSNPANMPTATQFTTGVAGSGIADIWASSKYLYLANAGATTAQFQVLDVSTPTSPSVIGTISNTGGAGTFITGAVTSMTIQGRYAYVGISTGTVYAVDLKDPAFATPVVTSVATSGTGAASLYAQGRILYVADNNSNRISAVDISTPGSPVAITSYSNTAGGAAAQAITGSGRYLYVGSGNSTYGFQVFDLGGTYSQQLETGGLETETLNVRSNSNVAGDIAVQGSLTVGNSTLLQGSVSVGGNITATNYATSTASYSTTVGATVNTTSITVNSATGFAAGDVIFINNAGQDYYTRIISISTNTFTVSPAVDVDANSGATPAVTKYIVQNIGATSTSLASPSLSDRFFQGYFLGGVVTGAGSTTLSDRNLQSSGAMNYVATSHAFTSTATTTSGLSLTASSLTTGSALSVTLAPTYTTISTNSPQGLNVTRTITANPTIPAVTVDKSFFGQAGNGIGQINLSATTNSATLANQTGMVIVAHVNALGGFSQYNCSATYNGNAMTPLNAYNGTKTVYTFIYLSPTPNASGSVSASCSDPTFSNNLYSMSVVANSFYNVSTYSSFASGSSAATPTFSLSTSDLAVDAAYASNGASPSNGWTIRAYAGFNGFSGNLGSATSTTGATGNWGCNSTCYDNNGLILRAAAAPVTINGSLATLSSNCIVSAGSCVDSSNLLNLNQQYASATGSVIKLQNSGSGADIQMGSGIIRPTTDSTTAIRIQNAAGTGNNVFTADTTNKRVGINLAGAPGYTLDVGGDINTSGNLRTAGTLLIGGAQISSSNLSDAASIVKSNVSNSLSSTTTFASTGTSTNGIVMQGTQTSSSVLLVTQNTGISVPTSTSNVLNVSRSVTANNGVSFNSFSHNSGNTTCTFSHTIGSQSNRLLLVYSTGNLFGGVNPSGVTYNGVAMTVVPGSSNNWWYMKEASLPATGTYNIVISGANANCNTTSYTNSYMASSWYNVNQTTPLGTWASPGYCWVFSGSCPDPSTVTTTTTAGDVVVDAHETGGAAGSTLGAGQTQIGTTTNNGYGSQSSYKIASGGSTTMTQQSYGSAIAQIAAIPIKPVAGLTTAFTGAVASVSSSCTDGASACADSSNVLFVNQQSSAATGTALLVQNAGSGAGFQVQNASAAVALSVSTANLSAGGWNASMAVLRVAKDTGTNRSISAAGTVDAGGLDYAEYIPWSGVKPEPGSIISYHGQSMVVSSVDTAAFIGSGGLGNTDDAILVAFAGQVPVKINGPINSGDYLVPNGDGTARGIAPSDATLNDYLAKVGTALETSTSTTVKALVSGPGASSEFNPQSTQSFADLNITGGLTTNSLVVTGSATFHGNIIVGGHVITAGNTPDTEVLSAAGAGATISIDGNDTAGTITITTGGGATVGDLGKLIFNNAFGKAPKTILSAQDEASQDAKIFPTGKSASQFTLRTSQALPAGTYTFDYFIVQ